MLNIEMIDNSMIENKKACILIPKIVNGSLLSIGRAHAKTILKVDQHFNWFQKLMWKWCFGIKVEDYSEE